MIDVVAMQSGAISAVVVGRPVNVHNIVDNVVRIVQRWGGTMFRCLELFSQMFLGQSLLR
jgi:hypothetical protein